MGADAQKIQNAARDPEALARLVEEYRPFILREASVAARRYLTDSDDEWSVALGAFSQAVEQYAPE